MIRSVTYSLSLPVAPTRIFWSPAASIVGALYHKLQTQSSSPEDGRNYRPKHVEPVKILIKLLLLHLVGYLYYYFPKFLSSSMVPRSWLHTEDPQTSEGPRYNNLFATATPAPAIWALLFCI